MTEFGYAGKILKYDISTGAIEHLATSNYSEKFIGGRGIAAKLYWDLVPPEVNAFDPQNALICVTGPVAGFFGLAGCRWQICGKTATMDRETFSYGNLGDKWGVNLKFNGYDGLVIQGKADKPVYLVIDRNSIELRDASHLWGKSTYDTIDQLKSEVDKNACVLTIGPAAENMVSFATLFSEGGSSGSGGLGSIMGSKNLKAVVVKKGTQRPVAANPEMLNKIRDKIKEKTRKKKKYSEGGPGMPWAEPGLTKEAMCYGCGIGCVRYKYKGKDGRNYKVFCQQTDIYRSPADKYYGIDKSRDARLLGIKLCDSYGLDTAVMQPMVAWLSDCYKEGVLTETETGLPLSKIGSVEFIESLTAMISKREGFGDLLAKGSIRAAKSIGNNAVKLLTNNIGTLASETREYDPRLMITNSLIYATEPRRPIQQLHELVCTMMLWTGFKTGALTLEQYQKTLKKYWGSVDAGDMTTVKGKALAAKKIQDRSYAKESLILCDLSWPMSWINDYINDPEVTELEARIASAITGRDIDEAGLHKIGERVFNMQRAILTRQGWGGREGDRILEYYHEKPLDKIVMFTKKNEAPGKNGEEISKMNAVVNRDDFDKMKDDYYKLRKWNPDNGLQTIEGLKDLVLDDIAEDLKNRNLLG